MVKAIVKSSAGALDVNTLTGAIEQIKRQLPEEALEKYNQLFSEWASHEHQTQEVELIATLAKRARRKARFQLVRFIEKSKLRSEVSA
jgi:hypothetical protein